MLRAVVGCLLSLQLGIRKQQLCKLRLANLIYPYNKENATEKPLICNPSSNFKENSVFYILIVWVIVKAENRERSDVTTLKSNRTLALKC